MEMSPKNDYHRFILFCVDNFGQFNKGEAMTTYYVGEDAVVLGFDEIDKLSIGERILACLAENDLPLWAEAEAEIFAFQGEKLLIARPRGPRLIRIKSQTPRLRRV